MTFSCVCALFHECEDHEVAIRGCTFNIFLPASVLARITKRPSWPRIYFCLLPCRPRSKSGHPDRTFQGQPSPFVGCGQVALRQGTVNRRFTWCRLSCSCFKD